MDEHFRFEAFGERHRKLRGDFDCGEEALDRYLRERARREMEQRVAAVQVLRDTLRDRLAGYYTLSAVSIQRDELPSEMTHRISRYRVYPATLLGRLAVDLKYRGQRLGGYLLLDALQRSLSASRTVASFAIVTDAKNERAKSFYERYGFRPLETKRNGLRLFLPMDTVRMLFDE